MKNHLPGIDTEVEPPKRRKRRPAALSVSQKRGRGNENFKICPKMPGGFGLSAKKAIFVQKITKCQFTRKK
ncbi:hypothetical protein [Dysosmobacter sp. Sow4_B12]|uniref:hypothetical protein n=1 Tax=Dysosmobacter sp. Sow4_B12 TaxID=3438777 RepID=UPI003F904A1B